MIEGYRLDTCLSPGANFRLYRAQELASGRSCLIRIVPPTKADTDTFLHEAKLASALFHPNIVDIYQTGMLDDGHAFVVTEDADGQTLRSFLDNFGVPKLLTSIEIVRQVAEAVHELHSAGVTHRAINPENIVVTKDAADAMLVRLLPSDFGGLAQHSTISNKFAIDGALASIRYFSPEQCSNEETDVRTDIYSLGIVFYELLAGAPPFDASSATALIHLHRSQSPPDIRIDNFELRMLVTHSLTESLQKPSRLRQSSANLLARQLRHIEQLATHSPTPPPAGTVSVQPPRKLYTPPFSPEPVMQTSEIVAPPPPPGVEIRTSVAEPLPVTEPVEQQSVLASVPAVTTISTSEPIVAIESLPIIASVEPAVEIQPSAVRRSRLKGWKKKLHTMAARLTEETVQTPLIAQAAEEIVEPAVAAAHAERIAEAEIPTLVAATLVTDETEEAAVDFAATSEVTAHESTTAKSEPAKIEWDQPLDDLPTLDEVAATVAEDKLVTVAGESETTVALSPVIELAEPIEERLPVAAVEISETEPVVTVTAEIVETVAPPPAEAVAVEPQIAVAEVIFEGPEVLTTIDEPTESEDPVVEIPRRTERIPARAVKAKEEDMGLKGDLPGFRMRRFVTSAQRVRVDDEEITIVRLPNRQTKRDVESRSDRPRQPRPRKLPTSNTVAYQPTLLGRSYDAPAIVGERRDGIFSDFDSAAGSRIHSYRRSIILGCGFIALMGFILFGNDSVSSYLQSSSSADSRSAASESNERIGLTDAAPEKVKPQPVERSNKALVVDKPVTKPEASKSKAGEAPNPKAVSSEPLKKAAARETKAADKKVVDKKAADKKAETPRKPVDKKPAVKKPSSQEKTAPGMRPRIVKTTN